MVGEQAGLLRAERSGACEREAGMAQDQLDPAFRQTADARPFPVEAKRLEVLFQIAQMAIGSERALALAVAQRVEMLVARERPRLVVQALEKPVEELAHPSRLARVRRGGSAKFVRRPPRESPENVKGGRCSGRGKRRPRPGRPACPPRTAYAGTRPARGVAIRAEPDRRKRCPCRPPPAACAIAGRRSAPVVRRRESAAAPRACRSAPRIPP